MECLNASGSWPSLQEAQDTFIPMDILPLAANECAPQDFVKKGHLQGFFMKKP